MQLLRSLIDRIVLQPAVDAAGGFLIDLEGDLAGSLSLCSDSKKAVGMSADGLEQIKLVAGARNQRCLPKLPSVLLRGSIPAQPSEMSPNAGPRGLWGEGKVQ